MIAALLVSCATVTVVSEPKRFMNTEPSYIDSKEFFFFGLIGKHDVDIEKICLGHEMAQMQTEFSQKNVSAALLTLGIYVPRTVKIWCDL